MKTLFITGISRGIGLATAQLFLDKGWTVIGTSTTGMIGLKHPNLTTYPLNLSNSQQIAKVAQQLPRIDVLINNAAILLEDWDKDEINMLQLKDTFSVNTFGTIELTEACIPKLNSNSQIINITSGWGSFSSNDSPYQPHYKMSKACLNMYTKLLAERFQKFTVSSFDPGWVKTDMGRNGIKLPVEVAKEIYDFVQKEKESGYFWYEGKIRAW